MSVRFCPMFGFTQFYSTLKKDGVIFKNRSALYVYIQAVKTQAFIKSLHKQFGLIEQSMVQTGS
jgi:hypothetical protein